MESDHNDLLGQLEAAKKGTESIKTVEEEHQQAVKQLNVSMCV